MSNRQPHMAEHDLSRDDVAAPSVGTPVSDRLEHRFEQCRVIVKRSSGRMDGNEAAHALTRPDRSVSFGSRADDSLPSSRPMASGTAPPW